MKKIFTLSCLLMLCSEAFSQFTYTYTGKPRFQILTKQNNAVLGIINVELFPLIAPRHVRNFDSLVSTGFYDTTAFHRCVPNFVIQGGDPNSRHGAISTWGYGEPGQPTVNAEFSQIKHIRGSLSAARSSNINSATSQFFICVVPTPNLNGQYSLYGRVTSGMTTVDNIVNTPKKPAPYTSMPLDKIEMFVTYIGSNDTIPNAPTLLTPANDSLEVDTTQAMLLKWNPTSDGLIYTVQVARDAAFTDVVATATTVNQSFLMSTGLTGYTTYYWRVKTNNGGNIGAYSDAWRFHTHYDFTSLNALTGTEEELHVFPNPGTGKFTFANTGIANKIEVFDLGGKLIQSSPVKNKTFELNLEGAEKGVYLYKLSAGSQPIKQGRLLLK